MRPTGHTGPLLSSYVCRPASGRWWNVSTIARRSSAQEAPGSVYDETIVWEWNPETRERAEMEWRMRVASQQQGPREATIDGRER